MQSRHKTNSQQENKILYSLSIIGLFSAIYSVLFYVHHQISIEFSIILGVLLFLVTFLGSTLLQLSQKYYHSPIVFTSANIIKVALFAGISTGLFFFFTAFISKWNTIIFDVVNQEIALIAIFIIFILSLLLTTNWIQQQKIREERIRLYAIAKEQEAQLTALNSIKEQFKPHFLFNSLNSIAALCLSKPEKAREMILLLSDFMRKNVHSNTKELVSLEEEVAHINKYISIEKIRFGNRLSVVIEIPPQTKKLLLPSLILQPIVENSIKYGVYGTLENVTIQISASYKENLLTIEICNPFDPEEHLSSKGTGFGLTSIEKRLQLIYGRGQLLSISKKGTTFCTQLQIPQK